MAGKRDSQGCGRKKDEREDRATEQTVHEASSPARGNGMRLNFDLTTQQKGQKPGQKELNQQQAKRKQERRRERGSQDEDISGERGKRERGESSASLMDGSA